MLCVCIRVYVCVFMGMQDAVTMRLVDMGFPKEASRAALIKHNGDENAAVNELIASL